MIMIEIFQKVYFIRNKELSITKWLKVQKIENGKIITTQPND